MSAQSAHAHRHIHTEKNVFKPVRYLGSWLWKELIIQNEYQMRLISCVMLKKHDFEYTVCGSGLGLAVQDKQKSKPLILRCVCDIFEPTFLFSVTE